MAVSANPPPRYSQNRHLVRKAFLLCITVTVVWALLATQLNDALWQTLALFLFVAMTGLGLITRLSHQLKDFNLQKLCDVFLVKLLLVVLILYAGWTPQLDLFSESFGYDPQRYYFEANALAKSGFSLSSVGSINYTGVLFYYGAIFWVFGHNPAIAAIVNVFVTLLATLLLVKLGYQIKPERGSHDWLLGLGMVIPEVIWFDVLTARETLSMSLIVIVTLSVTGYFIQRPGERLWSRLLPVAGLALLLLGIIRTSMLIPTAMAVAVSFVSFKLTARRRLIGLVLLCLGAMILRLSPLLSQSLGSYNITYVELIDSIYTRNDNFLETVSWNERSLGQLLIPDNAMEAVAFVPIRLFFNVVAPLPMIRIAPAGLMEGHWIEWQNLMQLLSALLYMALFPLAVAALIHALRLKEMQDTLVFHIPFWTVMLAIAGGNHIIHNRYRVMVALLLWGCIWLGQTCPKRLVRQVYFGWGVWVALGGMFYITYKFLL